MQVTVMEFTLNIEKYLTLVLTEDIWIMKNGKPVAKLVNPNISAVESISGVLAGKVPADLDRHSFREEKLFSRKGYACRRTLKERAGAYDGALNLSMEIDWGKPVGSELW